MVTKDRQINDLKSKISTLKRQVSLYRKKHENSRNQILSLRSRVMRLSMIINKHTDSILKHPYGK